MIAKRLIYGMSMFAFCLLVVLPQIPISLVYFSIRWIATGKSLEDDMVASWEASVHFIDKTLLKILQIKELSK